MGMNPQRISNLIEIAQEWWPQFQTSENTTEAWFLVLGQYDYEATAIAMREHLVNGNHYGKPDIGAIAKMLGPQFPDKTETKAKIDEWYRATSDVSRHPNRREREEFPLAAEQWDLVGGYEAMHKPAFANPQIAKAYDTAISNVKARMVTQSLAIASHGMPEVALHPDDPRLEIN